MIGHWNACCRKTRTQQRPSSSGKRDDRTPSNRHGKPRRRRTPSSHRENSEIHSVDTDYETDGESYQRSFYAITVSTQCLDAIDNRSTTRDEAFVVLDVQPPGLKGTGYTPRLKIDSRASGNTLPMRTFHQMYGDKADTRNSSSRALLAVPHHNLERFGRRGFSVNAPRLWNDLPDNLRVIDSVVLFKHTCGQCVCFHRHHTCGQCV